MKIKSVLLKDAIREILKTKTRFISIICMIILGIMVSVGMLVTVPTMKNTIIDYMGSSKLYDFKILSNRPLTEEDYKAIENNKIFSSVDKINYVKTEIENSKITLEVSSISEKFNIPIIERGHEIKGANEILLDRRLDKFFNLGDKIRLKSDKINSEYKIVGFIKSIDYLVASGDFESDTVTSFGYIDRSNFKNNDYRYLYVSAKNLTKHKFNSKKYNRKANLLVKEISDIFHEVSVKKYQKDRSKFEKNKNKLLNYKAQLSLLLKQKDVEKDKIEEAKKDIKKIDDELQKLLKYDELIQQPRYDIYTRHDSGAYSFYESADKILILSFIYAGFMFFIATLVSFTTIKRMVEDHRIQIGTLKALGYSARQISRKFFLYGTLASTVGILIGLILAHTVMVDRIIAAHTNSYLIPDYKLAFEPLTILINSAVAYICTTLSAYIALNNLLKLKVVELLRSKPPKAGSRIFLERLKFIWNKMNFFSKVTARNIFRHKARMWMTIIGISGCTGILFLGFSLRNSVKDIDKKQFSHLTHYDLIAFYDSSKDSKELLDYIKSNSDVDAFSTAYYDRTSIVGPSNEVINDIGVVISDNIENVISFVDVNDEKLNLTDEGAFSTVKLAYISKNEPKSSIEINTYGVKTKIRVDNLILNYIDNNIYMKKSYFMNNIDKKITENAVFIRLKNRDKSSVLNFRQKLSENSIIVNIEDNNSARLALERLSQSMDSVIVVMLVCSIFLAVVVLYNLTNININERNRELSTIKVLGMYPSELTGYIYKEVVILTLIGQVFGLLFGYTMYKYIAWEMPPKRIFMNVNTCLIDYVLSILITLIITACISVLIYRKLKNVNMVEALKSIE